MEGQNFCKYHLPSQCGSLQPHPNGDSGRKALGGALDHVPSKDTGLGCRLTAWAPPGLLSSQRGLLPTSQQQWQQEGPQRSWGDLPDAVGQVFLGGSRCLMSERLELPRERNYPFTGQKSSVLWGNQCACADWLTLQGTLLPPHH